jgi:hypothetical protein
MVMPNGEEDAFGAECEIAWRGGGEDALGCRGEELMVSRLATRDASHRPSIGSESE